MRIDRLALGSYKVSLASGEIWTLKRTSGITWLCSNGSLSFYHLGKKYAVKALEAREKESMEAAPGQWGLPEGRA